MVVQGHRVNSSEVCCVGAGLQPYLGSSWQSGMFCCGREAIPPADKRPHLRLLISCPIHSVTGLFRGLYCIVV